MLDLFIIVVILWSLYNGWHAGFIREALSTTGLLTGLLGASFVYSALGDTLVIATGNPINMVTNIIAFFLLWIIIPLVLGFAATLLTKMLGKLQFCCRSCPLLHKISLPTLLYPHRDAQSRHSQ